MVESWRGLISQIAPTTCSLPPERVIFLITQTCDALAEAHAHGLVHRDIKPGNIFAAQRGGVHDVAKLLDFGLVRPTADAESIDLTRDGAVAGSPRTSSSRWSAFGMKSGPRPSSTWRRVTICRRP